MINVLYYILAYVMSKYFAFDKKIDLVQKTLSITSGNLKKLIFCLSPCSRSLKIFLILKSFFNEVTTNYSL